MFCSPIHSAAFPRITETHITFSWHGQQKPLKILPKPAPSCWGCSKIPCRHLKPWKQHKSSLISRMLLCRLQIQSFLAVRTIPEDLEPLVAFSIIRYSIIIKLANNYHIIVYNFGVCIYICSVYIYIYIYTSNI